MLSNKDYLICNFTEKNLEIVIIYHKRSNSINITITNNNNNIDEYAVWNRTIRDFLTESIEGNIEMEISIATLFDFFSDYSNNKLSDHVQLFFFQKENEMHIELVLFAFNKYYDKKLIILKTIPISNTDVVKNILKNQETTISELQNQNIELHAEINTLHSMLTTLTSKIDKISESARITDLNCKNEDVENAELFKSTVEQIEFVQDTEFLEDSFVFERVSNVYIEPNEESNESTELTESNEDIVYWEGETKSLFEFFTCDGLDRADEMDQIDRRYRVDDSDSESETKFTLEFNPLRKYVQTLHRILHMTQDLLKF